ncbi:MAG TPA: hypothetical protein VG713_10955 [Pirellulales bacterium]|nr:hypothetical protein [Pirellulales bacterium]
MKPGKQLPKVSLDATRVPEWMQDLRLAMFDAVSRADIVAVMQSLVREAKSGNVQAAKLLLDYTVGASRPIVEGNLTIVNAATEQPSRPRPTTCQPGTPDKLSVLRERAAAGEELFNDDDERSISLKGHTKHDRA